MFHKFFLSENAVISTFLSPFRRYFFLIPKIAAKLIRRRTFSTDRSAAASTPWRHDMGDKHWKPTATAAKDGR
jgi:hypothetical protein